MEGPNFHFGHNRAGNVEVLDRLCREVGSVLEVVQPVLHQGEGVSSSRVRALLAAGDIERANELLTARYRLRGYVTHGAGRGARIGFATANLAGIDTLIPGAGVYAALVQVGGRSWPTAMNVGPNPTFGESALKVEAHLIGFEGNLYGQPLEVDFLARLRAVRAFASAEQLKQQLHQDCEAALAKASECL